MKAELRNLCELTNANPLGEKLLEEMRQNAARFFGVTLASPFVTLRFYHGRKLVEVTMQVVDISMEGEREDCN